MARYNRWMNDKLFAGCRLIPDADRKRDMGAFFRSIHDTLNHILYGDAAWMTRFAGEPLDAGLVRDTRRENFADLSDARRAMDARIVAWSDRLTPAWLEADFEYTSGVDGKTRVLPAWILVTHMFNHQTHHRGQVTTLMKQLGHDPGVTDLPWMPELDAVKD